MKTYYHWLIRIVTVIYCLYMYFFATSFSFMALNVFLAYIPIEISFYFEKADKKQLIAISFLWLLFYPNAPYLLTDFFHLETLPIYQGMNTIFSSSISAWLSFVLLTIGIFLYTILGMNTLFTLVIAYQRCHLFIKVKSQLCLLLLINLLTSLAIYVGRFDRLHSIHILLKPIQTFNDIFLSWSVNKILFIFLFTGMQIILLVGLLLIKLSSKEENLY